MQALMPRSCHSLISSHRCDHRLFESGRRYGECRSMMLNEVSIFDVLLLRKPVAQRGGLKINALDESIKIGLARFQFIDGILVIVSEK
jgi:hypothetical protein